MGKEIGAENPSPLLSIILAFVVFALLAALAYVALLFVLPNFMSTRSASQEVIAIGSVKALCSGQNLLQESDKDENGINDYGDLKTLHEAGLIDDVLASGTKDGYQFSCGPGADPTKLFWIKASPDIPGRTGLLYFYCNQSGVIYSSTDEFKVDTLTCKPARTLERIP